MALHNAEIVGSAFASAIHFVGNITVGAVMEPMIPSSLNSITLPGKKT
jgi:hypothetical protein